MRHRHFPIPALLLLLLSLGLCACSGPVLTKEALRPAQASEVARLTRLSVAPFENDHDGRVRAAVERVLTSIQVGGKPYFTIVGQDAPPPQSLGMPMQWGKGDGQAKGPRFGSLGLVQGAVGSDGWRDEAYYEQRRECLLDDAKGRCQFWGNRSVRCVKRRATFAFTPRVLDKQTGQVLMSKEFAQAEESSGCPDQSGPVGGQTLLSRAEDKALESFRRHVAPHVVTVSIPLVLEDGVPMEPGIKATLERGAELAKAGQEAEACRHFRAAANLHRGGFATTYLQGACAEWEDDLDAAEGFYREAQSRVAPPPDVVSAGLARLSQARADRDKLGGQLR